MTTTKRGKKRHTDSFRLFGKDKHANLVILTLYFWIYFYDTHKRVISLKKK